ncbi:MAG TPA: FHA domain-containing protein [Microcella sp.]|nr:FHA domain-containing protein [Microcella sp.]
MSELTLLLLRIGFLILMWSLVFAIVYALRSDLFGQKVRRMPSTGSGASSAAGSASAPAPVSLATPAAPTAEAPRVSTPPSGLSSVATGAVDRDDDGPARRLVITSGSKEGIELELDGDQLTIGRSSDSGLVIRDDYTSTHHARLMLWDGKWMVQDLDSTNGTFLSGKRVSIPTHVPLNTPVSIGTTTFELRR